MAGAPEVLKHFPYEIYVRLPGAQPELKLVKAVDEYGDDITVAQAKMELFSNAGIPNPEKYRMVFAKLQEVKQVHDDENLVDLDDELTGGYEIRFESQ